MEIEGLMRLAGEGSLRRHDKRLAFGGVSGLRQRITAFYLGCREGRWRAGWDVEIGTRGWGWSGEVTTFLPGCLTEVKFT